jgi:hypothetical protein
MNPVTFTSVLERKHKRELERLLFLNPGQHRVRSAIIEVVEKYGIPRVIDEQGRLRVNLDSGREVQTVFAIGHSGLRSRLAGVMVYTRLDVETILLMHMAVAKDYASGGQFGRQMLALRMVERLREIAGQVKGVCAVRLILGGGKVWDAPVQRAVGRKSLTDTLPPLA